MILVDILYIVVTHMSRTGVPIITTSIGALPLTEMLVTTPAAGQTLVYDGTKFVNTTSGGGPFGTLVSSGNFDGVIAATTSITTTPAVFTATLTSNTRYKIIVYADASWATGLSGGIQLGWVNDATAVVMYRPVDNTIMSTINANGNTSSIGIVRTLQSTTTSGSISVEILLTCLTAGTLTFKVFKYATAENVTISNSGYFVYKQ